MVPLLGFPIPRGVLETDGCCWIALSCSFDISCSVQVQSKTAETHWSKTTFLKDANAVQVLGITPTIPSVTLDLSRPGFQLSF